MFRVKQTIFAMSASHRRFLWLKIWESLRRIPIIPHLTSYIRRSSILLFSLYFSFLFTGFIISISKPTAIVYRGNVKAPTFQPQLIGELCESESLGAEKRIFFIESSGEKCLRPRQACAIESAARTNPDMNIYVHMALYPAPGSPEMEGGYGLNAHCQMMDILTKQFPNVKIIREDLTRHFIGTPLEALLQSGALEKSKFAYQHLSDAVRIAMLHKSGGIYLDLDVITLRSLNCLRNTAGEVRSAEYKAGIENGVLIFDKGHELLNHYMRLIPQIYDPSSRECIGPHGLLKAAGEFCGFGICEGCDFGQLWICRNNWNITVLYTEAFYPIPFRNRIRFYEPTFPLSELDNLQTSYLVHVYGSGHGAQVSHSSLYGFLAQRFCPSVYTVSSQSRVFNF
ncbi:lactosylceramide 4-alpha-galactosyltransferase-like [Daphnia carinata]|uniref:lactosylceramide 4-alpha-galactosyltransferase-like n=1 Tax=Daphnia carinata TaxID=120202 RepID=UPI00257F15D3|nr:lactosylceramide 4-alpha-galactosyltransferase-like [Daphnia carinata]